MLLTALSHLNILRPIVPTAALLGVSPTILLAHTSWRLVSLFLPKKMYYPVEDFIWEWYQKFVIFIFESWSKMEVVIKGNIPDKIENALVICNHQTTMDWIVMDFLANRQGMVGHMRFVFKNVLKYFPLFGYVWGEHGGIFIKRDGTYNAMKMRKTLNMLMDRKVPLYLVIYPEGTRFHPEKDSLLAKSRAYALQNHLEPLSHVLTPRIKAFHCALSNLGDYLDAVYDATIIYEPDGESSSRIRSPAPTMWDILSGKCKRVFIQFDRVPIADVPLENGLESSTLRWLHMRFKLKDDLLKKYYSGYQTVDTSKENGKSLSLTDLGAISSAENTILASASLVGVTAILLFTRTGRMLYATAVVGGSLLSMAYSHFFF